MQFNEAYDEYEIVKFTIANPTILDEHYSGPAPTRTTTDPPLVHEPVAVPGVARIRGDGCAVGDTAGCRIQGREGLIDYAITITIEI